MFDAAFTKTCRETAAQTTFTFDSPPHETVNVTETGLVTALTASIADPSTAEFGYDGVYGQANFIIFEPDRTPPDLDFHVAPLFPDICNGALAQGNYLATDFGMTGIVKVEMLVPRLGIVLELFSSETPEEIVTGVWSFQIPQGLQRTNPWGTLNIDLMATDEAGNVGRLAGGFSYSDSCDG